ncbi:MAG: metal-dependent transcriptional regulator [candidate division Zixibacteria bacterium]|nr:metal-dependent transcriptional regulator [candidate division Zixibacteria bacterium]
MNKTGRINHKPILKIGQLSESLEDYLEIIFELAQKQGAARVRDIAKAKKVQMPSVTSALKRLEKESLITYEAREFARLTSQGENLARSLLKRHYFLKSFLVDILKVDPKTAAKDACSMEHALSQKTMSRFYDFSEFLGAGKNGIRDILKSYHDRQHKND